MGTHANPETCRRSTTGGEDSGRTVNIVLVGPSASGKSTLAEALTRLGVKRIRSYTTRPRRPGEEGSCDYEFVSDSEFEHISEKHGMSVVREYRVATGDVWKYGISMGSFNNPEDKATVCILDPEGYEELKTLVPKVFGVLLDIPKDVRMERAMARGDDMAETRRRFHADDEAFSAIMADADGSCAMVLHGGPADEEAAAIMRKTGLSL